MHNGTFAKKSEYKLHLKFSILFLKQASYSMDDAKNNNIVILFIILHANHSAIL